MDSMKQGGAKTPQHLQLTDRAVLTVDGVIEVLSFDGNGVRLDTVCGLLDIEGTGLGVKNLSLETGKVEIEGVVGGLWYSEKREKPHRSLFGGRRD